MVVYSVIMFLAAVLLGGISIAIYRGKTGLIQAYHQPRVTDQSAYGKSFSKAMIIIPAAMLLSGTVSLLDNSETAATIAVAVLFIGLTAGIACMIAVQKKYNNGIF